MQNETESNINKQQWRHTPIPKKSGIDSADPKSYRPIYNLSVLFELLARLVAEQLVSYLKDNNLLPDLRVHTANEIYRPKIEDFLGILWVFHAIFCPRTEIIRIKCRFYRKGDRHQSGPLASLEHIRNYHWLNSASRVLISTCSAPLVQTGERKQFSLFDLDLFDLRSWSTTPG